MKRNVSTFTVIEGDPNLINNNELWYKKYPNTGFIDIQKRDDSGNLKSIVQNTNILANPDIPMQTIVEASEFNNALSTLIDLGTEQGFEVSKDVYITDVNIIRKYLPEEKDVTLKACNIIGFIGHKTDDGGFILYSAGDALYAEVRENTILLMKENNG